MRLLLVRHLWGVDLSRGYAPHLKAWRAAGYEALEASPRLVPDAALLRRTLRKTGLRWIPQVFTHMFNGGGGLKVHLQSLREQIEECVEAAPLFINGHTGSDSWNLAEAEDFYGATLDLEKQLGVTLLHETHRSRCFGNPWTTYAILKRLPELKLTCDFSHWVCVAERLLGDCGPILELAARRCRHLHARVGHEQGPQVADPRAAEATRYLNAHENWWEMIWMAQKASGLKVSTLTPEFGPPPYLPVMPYTQKPVANLEDICDWMARRQAARFGALFPTSAVR